MTLGIFLSLGESFTDLKKKGQDQLMIDQNIRNFASSFDKVLVFTYEQEKVKLPENCTLITPPIKLHRYLYGLTLPFFHAKILKTTNVWRCFQLSGALPAIVAKIFFKKKFVFNLGYDYRNFALIEKKYIQAALISAFSRLAIYFADHIIVKTQTLMKTLPPRARSKTTYLPNGVDINRFKPRRKKAKRVPIILFIGRLEPQKNLLSLIKALSLIKEPFKLQIVGDGSLRNQILKLTKKTNINLKITRKVSHRRIEKIYQQADIFVLPSIKEGSPKVLLEAMASGLACVASNIPEHREIIESKKHGILSSLAPDRLAQAISQLLKSYSQRENLGRQARNQVKRNFDIRKIISQEITILKNI